MIQTFAISGLINGLLSFAFGFFIIIHGWRLKLNRVYFFLTTSVSFWALSYWQWLSSVNEVDALFWVRMLSIGSIMIPVAFFHWTISFLDINERYRNVTRIIYVTIVILLSFSFSGLFIKGVQQKLFFPFWPEPGILYHFYLFFIFIFLTIYSLILLIKSYKSSTKEKRGQIIYVFAGSAIALSGGMSNFFLWYNIPIPPYGNFLIALFPLLFGYAMVRHKLFNVRIITTELFTFGIWAALFVKTLLSLNSARDLLIDASIFIWSIVFGTLLIRSVIHEVEQKNKIEAMAGDVKKAYEIEKKAKEELVRIDEAKSQFIMATQHHLRTPLTALKGYLSMALDNNFGPVGDVLKEKLGFCFESTNRLIKLVNEFLDISKMQLGRDILDIKEVSITEILRDIIVEVKPEADNKGIYLTLTLPPEPAPLIAADATKLREALYNLIDNAVKYTEKGGVKVDLRFIIKGKNNYARMVVTDTGIGMTKEETADVFGRQFERGREAKKVYTLGRGIGLFIAASIIKAHKGRIWAESSGSGQGSVFYVELAAK